MSGVPGPWVRRPISVAVLITTILLWPVLFPLALLVGLLADLVVRDRRRRRFRAALLIGLLLIAEVLGFISVLAIWLIAPFGLRLGNPRNQNRLRWVMHRWAVTLLWAIRVGVPLEMDTSELDPSLLDANAIIIGRHRSLLDAILPAVLFGGLGYYVRYTLKEDLRWEPNIDVVGHVMPHHFVTRSPQDLEAELGPIRELAEGIDEQTVGVIFPEGTFFTQERKQQIIASLERKDPDHVEPARAMQYVLPPRPAGTLALLEGAPHADVIVLGHTGFEQFGSIRNILANLGDEHRIMLRAWRIDRAEIPDDEEGRIDWLFDVWGQLDRWIASTHSADHVG